MHIHQLLMLQQNFLGFSDIAFHESIKKLNLENFSYKKQIYGQISLNETKLSIMEHWNAEITVRGGRMDQHKLFEAEAEVEARYWERRNSGIALKEINLGM